FGRESGPSAAAAMTNDGHVAIGKFVFDFKFNRSAAEVECLRNMLLVELILVPNIDNHRVAAALRFLRGIGRRNFGDLLFRLRDQILESLLFSHKKCLTTNGHE